MKAREETIQFTQESIEQIKQMMQEGMPSKRAAKMFKKLNRKKKKVPGRV